MSMDIFTSLSSKKLVLSSQLDSLVLKIGVGYLLFPYFLFFWGWLRLPIAILLICALIFSFWRFTYLTDREYSAKEEFSIPWLVVAIAVVLIGIWLLYSGVGHFSDQVGDYKKHNLILAHLINQDWPVIQKITDKSSYILIYYIAYYLPASIVGKYFGIVVANAFQFLFSLIGILLSIYLLFTIIGRRKILYVVILFILFGGMDILGGQLLNGSLPNLQDINEGWATPYIYQGNTVMLFFSPQQVIPGWLATLAIIHLHQNKVGYGYLIFIWALTLLWAPWVFIGLLPFITFILLKNVHIMKNFLSFTNTIPVFLIFAVCLPYYSTNRSSIRNNYWVWTSNPKWLTNYIVFILTEFLILGIVLLILNWNKKFNRELLFIGLGTLSLIPFYHSGVFNDFCMRASIPGLMIICTVAISTVINPTKISKGVNNKFFRTFALIILSIGSVMGIARLITSIKNTNQIHGGLFYLYPITYESDLFKSFNDIPSDIILEQYLARNVDFRDYHWLFKY